MVLALLGFFRALLGFARTVLSGFSELWKALATPWLLLVVVFTCCAAYLLTIAVFGWLKAKAQPSKESDHPYRLVRPSLRRFGWITLPWWCLKRLVISIGAGTDSPATAATGLIAVAALGVSAYAYFLEAVPQRTIEPQVKCVRVGDARPNKSSGKAPAVTEAPLQMRSGTHRLQIVMPNQASAYIYGCRFQIWPEFETADGSSLPGWQGKTLEGDDPDPAVREQSFACGQEKDAVDMDLFDALRLSANDVADQLSQAYRVPWFNLRVTYKRGLSERHVVLTSRPCEY